LSTTTQKELAKRKIERAVKKLDPKDAEELLVQSGTNKAVQAKQEGEGRVPGKTRGITKTTWTLADWEKFGVEKFEPEETVKITLNGVSRQFVAGMEGLYPTRFVQEYKRLRRERMKKVVMPDRGYVNIVEPGAGSFVD